MWTSVASAVTLRANWRWTASGLGEKLFAVAAHCSCFITPEDQQRAAWELHISVLQVPTEWKVKQESSSVVTMLRMMLMTIQHFFSFFEECSSYVFSLCCTAQFLKNNLLWRIIFYLFFSWEICFLRQEFPPQTVSLNFTSLFMNTFIGIHFVLCWKKKWSWIAKIHQAVWQNPSTILF